MSRLSHPGIVKLLNKRDTAQAIELTLEFGGTLTLASYIETHILTTQTVRSIFKQLVSALEYLHSQGVAHRDLKPENTVVEDVDRSTNWTPRVKLIDFGFAAPCFSTSVSYVDEG